MKDNENELFDRALELLSQLDSEQLEDVLEIIAESKAPSHS